MTVLRSTVIAKTDISQFTSRVAGLSEAELSALLDQHKRFVSEVVAKNQGSIIKGEGDSFWIVFPSATTAARAAVEMQQELRMMQSGKGDERLAIRVVITLGDVLHQDNDIFGDAVNLASRIEAVTPPDEIYLSQAAWLALNKSEVQTSFVNEFVLQDIKDPARVYKVEQRYKTRIIKDQIVVTTDIGGFTLYYQSHSIDETDNLLLYLDQVTKSVCEENGGSVRIVAADGHVLTFPEAQHALAATEKLCLQWIEFTQQNDIPCGLQIGVHKGDVRLFRSCIYGFALNEASTLQGLKFPSRTLVSAVVSGRVRDEVEGTRWERKLRQIREAEIDVTGYHRLLVEGVFKEGIYLLDASSSTATA